MCGLPPEEVVTGEGMVERLYKILGGGGVFGRGEV